MTAFSRERSERYDWSIDAHTHRGLLQVMIVFRGGVRARLDDTYFAWIGEGGPDSVFYYRIHSPVLLIEFDHQNPVGLRPLYPGVRSPIRQHVHVVIRTPNGNDYGKDLLRQHYARSHRSE